VWRHWLILLILAALLQFDQRHDDQPFWPTSRGCQPRGKFS
jgi:hypothetical protein